MTSIDHFDYELPKELIAQQPLRQRTDARLMVIDRKRGAWEHHHIRDLPQILSPQDLLVVNDTRVLPARLVGRRTATGGRWQGLFLRSDANGNWLVMSQTRGKLQPNETVTLDDRRGQPSLPLRMISKLEGGQWAAHPMSDTPLVELLEEVGRVPLPPYIRQGEMVPSDLVNYQTMFAGEPGAVAAPTAGLHFTPELVTSLETRGIETARITLHVGEGTFRPVMVDDIADHVMHFEHGAISAETAARLESQRAAAGRVVAVGTTSTRVLETAARNPDGFQWQGETNLFIRPSFEFRCVDALLTNFHLPRSTLLILVYTFGGSDLMRRAYEAAVEEQYRFYSYGDAMLIL